MEPSIELFVRDHPEIQLSVTETNFNPYRREYEVDTAEWAIRLSVHYSTMRFNLSTEKGIRPTLATVLATLSQECRAFEEAETAEDFADRIGQPFSIRDQTALWNADFLWRVAERHRDELQALLGDAIFEELMGRDPLISEEPEPVTPEPSTPATPARHAEAPREPPLPRPKNPPTDDGLGLW